MALNLFKKLSDVEPLVNAVTECESFALGERECDSDHWHDWLCWGTRIQTMTSLMSTWCALPFCV